VCRAVPPGYVPCMHAPIHVCPVSPRSQKKEKKRKTCPSQARPSQIRPWQTEKNPTGEGKPRTKRIGGRRKRKSRHHHRLRLVSCAPRRKQAMSRLHHARPSIRIQALPCASPFSSPSGQVVIIIMNRDRFLGGCCFCGVCTSEPDGLSPPRVGS